MFVTETVLCRGQRTYTHLQLVEGYRDEHRRVRQRVVANLGRKDRLQASGQLLRKVTRSFARLQPPSPQPRE